MSIVGLLLSRSAELLHSTDRHGKTGLHIAATYGHYQMMEVLIGQGADINGTDKNGWTPLHCCAKAGFLDVVKLLTTAGASPKVETNYGCAPIWFAASEGHNDVLKFLMHKEHDTYGLMEDKRFVYNLMVISKNNNDKPIEEFILVSPAPVDTAAKLSNIYIILSTKEKERAKDLVLAGKQCEAMATELLALSAGSDSAGRILTAVDRRNVEFLDVLIENEQKDVIAHTVVQRYLQVRPFFIPLEISFNFFQISGTLARKLKVGSMEDNVAVFRIHNLSSGVGNFHPAPGPQIQQSAHHQIHVVSYIPHLFNVAVYDGRHSAAVSCCETEPGAVLVRVVSARVAERSTISRINKS